MNTAPKIKQSQPPLIATPAPPEVDRRDLIAKRLDLVRRIIRKREMEEKALSMQLLELTPVGETVLTRDAHGRQEPYMRILHMHFDKTYVEGYWKEPYDSVKVQKL